ncbi:MAG: RND family transporter, partial [Thermoplasmata archaeon]
MLERLSLKVQSYAVYIVVIVIVLTILFAGTLPSVKVLTNWGDFYPDNEVVGDFNRINNDFGRSSKFHYVYAEAKNGGDVLSPAALREQYNLTLEVNATVTGVEDVMSIAGFINQGCEFLFNNTKNILNATDSDIELVKSVAVNIYQGNYQGELPLEINVDEIQMLMATLLPSDFDPANPAANATLIVVMIYGNYDEPRYKKISLRVRDTVNNMEFEEIRVKQTSNALLTYDVDQTVWNTTITLGLAVFFLIAVLLALSFRDYTYVLLPCATLLIVAVWTFGSMVLLGIDFTVVEVAVLPLIAGLGIDYSVHVSRRYQEELRKGKNVSDALTQSLKMVGSALSLSVATTIIAFLSNVFSDIKPIRNFGILCSLGIFYAFLLTLTFQSAARFLLDSRGEARVISRYKKDIQVVDRGVAWGALTVKRFPALVLVIVLVLTVLSAFAATGVEREFSLEDFIPSDWPTMKTTNIIRSQFASASYTQEYILLEGNITSPELMENMAVMEENIADDKYVVKVNLLGENRVRADSIRKFMVEALERNQSLAARFNLTNDGHTTTTTTEVDIHNIFLYLYTNQSYQDRITSVLHYDRDRKTFDATVIRVFVSAKKTSEAREVYNELKADVIETQGVNVQITGETVLVITTIDSFQRSQIVSTGFAIIASAVVLMIVYRNPLLGATAVIPVAISTIWILGTMALLGISVNVFTVMVTAMTIGLGIDYSIHIIERFREESRHYPPRKSMQTTIERTGSAIFISALTTVCGFAVLLLSPMPLTQHFGIITAATIVYSWYLAVFV